VKSSASLPADWNHEGVSLQKPLEITHNRLIWAASNEIGLGACWPLRPWIDGVGLKPGAGDEGGGLHQRRDPESVDRIAGKIVAETT
jgi:hypothetical protein